MIKNFIDLWMEHKIEFQRFLENCNGSEIDDYKFLVKHIVEKVINKGDIELNLEALTVINDGDYQGTQIYILPVQTYQPTVEDYYFTSNYYGSCSGCDTLQSIINYQDGALNSEQVAELMLLSLNLIEQFKKLIPES